MDSRASCRNGFLTARFHIKILLTAPPPTPTPLARALFSPVTSMDSMNPHHGSTGRLLDYFNDLNLICFSSFYAPHDTQGLIELMGGNETFVNRLDAFFEDNFYLAGNEPSFQTPVGYHYAGRPTKSVQRVRKVVAENFNICLFLLSFGMFRF